MAVYISAGSQIHIASTYGSNATATAATNAANCVVTAAGHGAAVNDYVEIVSSPWSRLEKRVFRVSAVATNDITLEGCDTSNTTIFPAAGGVGMVLRRISAWTQITQVGENIDWTSGDLQRANATFLEHDVSKEVPVRRGADTLMIPFFLDPALAWLSTVRQASDTNEYRSFRLTSPSGFKALLCGLVNLKDSPGIEDNTYHGRIEVFGQAKTTVYAT